MTDGTNRVNVDLASAAKVFGSYNKIAARLKVAHTTVHGWKQRGGRVPYLQGERIIEAAREDGHEVVEGDPVTFRKGTAAKAEPNRDALLAAARAMLEVLPPDQWANAIAKLVSLLR